MMRDVRAVLGVLVVVICLGGREGRAQSPYCPEPPPPDIDDAVRCGGKSRSMFGDPVAMHGAQAYPVHVVEDFSIATAVGRIPFKRLYVGSDQPWGSIPGNQTEAAVSGVYKPFGDSHTWGASLRWTHSYFGVLQYGSNAIRALLPTGRQLEFSTAGASVPGSIIAASPNAPSQQGRAYRRDTNTIQITTDDDGVVYEFSPSPESSRWLLTAIKERRVSHALEYSVLYFTYDHVYALTRVDLRAPAGGANLATLTFNYSERPDGPHDHGAYRFDVPILRSINVASGGYTSDSREAVQYSYASSLGNTFLTGAGVPSGAAGGTDWETYEYNRMSGGTTVFAVKHEFGATADIKTQYHSANYPLQDVVSGSDGQGSFTIEAQSSAPYAGCGLNTCCAHGGGLLVRRAIRDSLPRGDGTRSSSTQEFTFERAYGESTHGPRLIRRDVWCSAGSSGCQAGNELFELDTPEATACSIVPSSEGRYEAEQVRSSGWTIRKSDESPPTTSVPERRETGVRHLTGALQRDGTGALGSTYEAFEYASSGDGLERKRTVRTDQPSVNGGVTSTYRTYSSEGILLSTIQEGWAAGSSYGAPFETRFVATFSSATRSCDAYEVDSQGRTLHEEGPCFVSGINATSCDSEAAPPIREFYYYPDDSSGFDSGQLRKVVEYPNGCGSSPLETTYKNYDAWGHAQSVRPPNGMVTYQYMGNELIYTSGPSGLRSYAYENKKVVFETDELGNLTSYCYRNGPVDIQHPQCTGTWDDRLHFEASVDPGGTVQRLRVTEYGAAGDQTGWKEYGLKTDWSNQLELRREGKVAQDTEGAVTRTSFVGATGDTVTRWTPHNAERLPIALSYAHTAQSAFCMNGTSRAPQCAHLAHTEDALLKNVELPTLTGAPVSSRNFYYDGARNLSLIRGPGTGLTDMVYGYDDFGNIISAKTPSDLHAREMRYDARGHLVALLTKESSGAVDQVAFEVDGWGRQRSVQGSGYLRYLYYDAEAVGAPLVDCSATYSPSSSGTGAGRLRAEVSPTWTTYYMYNFAGQVTQESRVPRSATSCGVGAGTLITQYQYDAAGRLTQIRYPHGLVVTYGYAGHLLYSVNAFREQNPSASLLSAYVFWEPYTGELRHMLELTPTGDYTFTRYTGGNPEAVPSPSQRCARSVPALPSQNGADRSNRASIFQWQRGQHPEGSVSSSNLVKVEQSWKGDQLVLADTCYNAQTQSVRKLYGADGSSTWDGYDLSGQIIAHSSGYWSGYYGGGAGTDRYYTYDLRGNRTAFGLTSDYWLQIKYDYEVGPSSEATDRVSTAQAYFGASAPTQMRWQYEYDALGNQKKKLFPSHASGTSSGWSSPYVPSWVSESAPGLSPVVHSIATQYGVYSYYYDSFNRRTEKEYPTGEHDLYVWSSDRSLLEDLFMRDSWDSANMSIDEYVWLGGMPIAMFRRELQAGEDATSGCVHRNEVAACGFHGIAVDHRGSPIAMWDGSGSITGVAEYDPFGDANKYMGWVAAGAPTYYGETDLHTYVEPEQGMKLDYRVRLDLFDIEPPCAYGWDYLYFTNLSGVEVGQRTSGGDVRNWTSWAPANGGAKLMMHTNGSNYFGPGCSYTSSGDWPYSGVGASMFEFRRYQAGASPFFTSLRAPGQYHDQETDYFENWHRYYDPTTGRYLSPEPLLQDPNWVRSEAQAGFMTPTYAYARNNPSQYIDPTGLAGTCGPGGLRCATNAAGEIVEAGAAAGGAASIDAFAAGLAVAAAEILALEESRSRWDKAKDAIREICRKPKKWYACAAACQGNGAEQGADWLVGWSNTNCAEATRQAKEGAGIFGQVYARHCACIDTDGFKGTGTSCENHRR